MTNVEPRPTRNTLRRRRPHTPLVSSLLRSTRHSRGCPRSANTPGEGESMPSHWHKPGPILHGVPALLFTILCLIAFGKPDLEVVWENSQDDEKFIECKDRMVERITTVSVVGGLILSSTAAFATTTPPVGHVLNYNIRAAYLMILLSLGLTIGGLIVASAVVYVMYEAQRTWFTKVVMGDRSSICCLLILLGYPFLAIGVSTAVMAMGLLTAVWKSADILAKIGGAIVITVPVSMIPLFIWTQRPLLPRLAQIVVSDGNNHHRIPTEDQEIFVEAVHSQHRSVTEPNDTEYLSNVCWCQAVERAGGTLLPLMVLLPDEVETEGRLQGLHPRPLPNETDHDERCWHSGKYEVSAVSVAQFPVPSAASPPLNIRRGL